MKFAVGYQQIEDGGDLLTHIVRDYREYIHEVYFPWVFMPSGRAELGCRKGERNWSAQAQLEEDLRTFRSMGLALDLVLNANCYGRLAVSRSLEREICSLMDYLNDAIGGVEAVTTASLAVAHILKKHFPAVEVRASVNMRIGTVSAMEYVADLFDGFYVQRDFNRDLNRLEELKIWADTHHKRLCFLVNSGCLPFCSGQSFHDNLVAHEREIDETENMTDWSPFVCWNRFREKKNWVSILRGTWIRPEDLHHYDGIFSIVKLATRMHACPRIVIAAYCSRSYRGNLLDLLEPGFVPAFAPYVLDNARFPPDWFERTSSCRQHCGHCKYCDKVFRGLCVPVTCLLGGAAGILGP
ncbi:MAG: hypothetical protein PHV34_13895 [Verrucomicrobiae bacterium]|nr:hypothetical protein [Verrucomicrobiae bacterium]